MNEPRCEMKPIGVRCMNQAAGWWAATATGPRIAMCEDCRDAITVEMPAFVHEWEPLLPETTRTLIAARLLRMAAGWFGGRPVA